MEDVDKTHSILAYGNCGSCGTAPGTEQHTCPYAEEVHSDMLSTCNCCDECCAGCAEDI